MGRALRCRMVVALVALSAASTFLAGCDIAASMAEWQRHEGPVAAEIERVAGKRPSVTSAAAGAILVVTVQFAEVPSVPVPSLEAAARAAIVREFNQEPNSLTIAFVYNKWPM